MDFRKALLSKPPSEPKTRVYKSEIPWNELTALHQRIAAKNATDKKCHLLEKVPREIRDKIWRLLFKREPTILPYYPFDYHLRTTVMSITKPTSEQRSLIATGVESLPFLDFTGQTCCEVVRRGLYGAQVISKAEVSRDRLSSVKVLRTCSQIYLECAQILYGENKFSFDLGSTSLEYDVNTRTYYKAFSVHLYDEFQHMPQLIPGLARGGGLVQSKQQDDIAINRLFVPAEDQPKFVARDPLLKFMQVIGRVNTSLLTNITLQGYMKTATQSGQGSLNNRRFNAGIGLARLLPILTNVLQKACPVLKSLTLDMSDVLEDRDNMLWDDDWNSWTRKSDEERIDECVENIVRSLPQLQELQLGSVCAFRGLRPGQAGWFVDPWGVSVRWMKVVEERPRNLTRAGRVAIGKRLEAIATKHSQDLARFLEMEKERDEKREEENRERARRGKLARGGHSGRGGRGRGRGGRGEILGIFDGLGWELA